MTTTVISLVHSISLISQGLAIKGLHLSCFYILLIANCFLLSSCYRNNSPLIWPHPLFLQASSFLFLNTFSEKYSSLPMKYLILTKLKSLNSSELIALPSLLSAL